MSPAKDDRTRAAGPTASAPRGRPAGEPRVAAWRKDTRVIVGVVGSLAFLPPVIALFQRDNAVFGVPLLVLYVFGAWLAGIAVTALVARSSADRARPD